MDATELDAAPLETEYQRLRAERAAARRAEQEREAARIAQQREVLRTERDTAFAKVWAVDRLRRFDERHGAQDRIGRVIAEAARVFPAARRLEPAELLKAAA